MDITVRINGTDHHAEVQLLKNTLWVHHAGRTFVVEDSSTGRKARKGTSVAASDQVLAPMPGKVTKILVTLGQEIEKGQALLVMEAMKMEYTLKAEIAGSVSTILCQQGDQVVLGKLLVKLEPAKS
jgi:biotin carboxyl carrier protein